VNIRESQSNRDRHDSGLEHARAVDKIDKMTESTSEERISLASSTPISCAKRCLGGCSNIVTVVVAASRHHQIIRLSVGSLIVGSIMLQNAALASFAKAKGERILIRLRRKLGFQTLNQSTVDFHSISFREALAKANVEAWTASCT
jgi:hypothetical protein